VTRVCVVDVSNGVVLKCILSKINLKFDILALLLNMRWCLHVPGCELALTMIRIDLTGDSCAREGRAFGNGHPLRTVILVPNWTNFNYTCTTALPCIPVQQALTVNYTVTKYYVNISTLRFLYCNMLLL